MSTLQQHGVGVRRTAAGSMICDHSHEAQLVKRQIQAEFEYLPGLRLTFAQARRLFGLEPDCCARILAVLVEEGSLTLTADGAYAKAARARFNNKSGSTNENLRSAS